jgi:hypothetical protein
VRGWWVVDKPRKIKIKSFSKIPYKEYSYEEFLENKKDISNRRDQRIEKYNPKLLSGMNRTLIAVLQVITAKPAFMNELNNKFSELMRNPSIQKQVIKDAEDYSEGYEEDEILERAFDEIYPAWMDEMERIATFEGNGLIVYRGISARTPDDIDYDNTGVYWTWDESKAGNYSDRNTKLPLHTLTGLVQIKDMDLKGTFLKVVWPGYELEESEKEITLKPNQKIKLLGNPDRDSVTAMYLKAVGG